MEPLFQSRVGAIIAKRAGKTNLYWGFWFRPSWPFAKLEVYNDYLIIKVFSKQTHISFKDIDYIQKKLAVIRIFHHAPNVYEFVGINGIFTGSRLFRKLKETILQNNLRIKIKQ